MPDRRSLGRLGAQARQARTTGRGAGGGVGWAVFSARTAVHCHAGNPIHRDAGQRHAVSAWSPARTGRDRGAPLEPPTHRPGAASRRGRLRHPATAGRDPAAAARGGHAVSLAVRRAVRRRPLQCRQLRGLPGPVRRGHLHRQGLAECRRDACGAGAAPAGAAHPEPRPAGGGVRPLRGGDRRDRDRGHADPRRRGGGARAPLDAWRLATAHDPAAPAALSHRRDQSLEDAGQPAPLAGGADVARTGERQSGDAGSPALRGAGAGGGGILRRTDHRRADRPGAERETVRARLLLSQGGRRCRAGARDRRLEPGTAVAARAAARRRGAARAVAHAGLAASPAAMDDGGGRASRREHRPDDAGAPASPGEPGRDRPDGDAVRARHPAPGAGGDPGSGLGGITAVGMVGQPTARRRRRRAWHRRGRPVLSAGGRARFVAAVRALGHR